MTTKFDGSKFSSRGRQRNIFISVEVWKLTRTMLLGQKPPRLHNTTVCLDYIHVLAVSSHDGAPAASAGAGAPLAGGQDLRVHPRLPTM